MPPAGPEPRGSSSGARPPPAGRALFLPQRLRLRPYPTPSAWAGPLLKGQRMWDPVAPSRGKPSKGNRAQIEGRRKKWGGKRPKAAGTVPSVLYAPSPTLCLIILPNYNSQGKESRSGGQKAGVNPYLVPNVKPDALSVSVYRRRRWERMMVSGRFREAAAVTKGTGIPISLKGGG